MSKSKQQECVCGWVGSSYSHHARLTRTAGPHVMISAEEAEEMTELVVSDADRHRGEIWTVTETLEDMRDTLITVIDVLSAASKHIEKADAENVRLTQSLLDLSTKVRDAFKEVLI